MISGLHTDTSSSQTVVPRPTASASPGNMLEIQIHAPTPDLLKQKSGGRVWCSVLPSPPQDSPPHPSRRIPAPHQQCFLNFLLILMEKENLSQRGRSVIPGLDADFQPRDDNCDQDVKEH